MRLTNEVLSLRGVPVIARPGEIRDLLESRSPSRSTCSHVSALAFSARIAARRTLLCDHSVEQHIGKLRLIPVAGQARRLRHADIPHGLPIHARPPGSACGLWPAVTSQPYPARTTAPIGCAPDRDIDLIPGVKPQVNVVRERSIPVSA